MILVIRCGWPAAPKPAKTKPRTNGTTPNASRSGNSRTRLGSCSRRFAASASGPPISRKPATTIETIATIITSDCAASVQMSARIPPA